MKSIIYTKILLELIPVLLLLCLVLSADERGVLMFITMQQKGGKKHHLTLLYPIPLHKAILKYFRTLWADIELVTLYIM